MRKYFSIILLITIPFLSFSQNRDYGGWIDFGSSHASKWLQIAPGKLGPNALPVPNMDYALIGDESKLEIGTHFHQMAGDTALNTYFNWHWNLAPGRVAVEIWGQPTETFRLTNELRDDRQIYYDDEGWITQIGDLFISTFIQIIKEKKYLPDVTINFTQKTTTGENDHGRYTDAPMSYFYFALGKSFHFKNTIVDEIRIAGLAGFYVWQTNKVEMAQDEGPVWVTGLQLRKQSFNWHNEFGGYTGYDAYKVLNRIYGDGIIEGHNDPLIFRSRIEKTGKTFNITAEYQTGFRDYHYQTLKLGLIYRFKTKGF